MLQLDSDSCCALLELKEVLAVLLLLQLEFLELNLLKALVIWQRGPSEERHLRGQVGWQFLLSYLRHFVAAQVDLYLHHRTEEWEQ